MANANFTCVLDAWRSGTTLYGRMHYYRTDGQTFSYSDSSFPNPTMDLGGTVYTDTAFGNWVRSGISVGDVYTTTFSRTVSGTGSRTVTFTAGSGQRSDFAGTWSATVTGFPGTTTPPTDLVISEPYNITTTGAKFDVSVSSYGTPASASGRYIEAAILETSDYNGNKRAAIASNVNSAAITVNNNSTQVTSLTIKPNTEYYYGAYASNTQTSTMTVSGQFVTLPAAPTVYVADVDGYSATIHYSVGSDGGHYNRLIEYSLDGAWHTAVTISDGNAHTGTFTITNLKAHTSYTMGIRVRTEAGGSGAGALYFTTKSMLYGAAKHFGNLQLKGDTTQQTYSGKNLFNFGQFYANRSNFTTNDGTINVTYSAIEYAGHTGTGSQWYPAHETSNKSIYGMTNLQPSTTYTLSYEATGDTQCWVFFWNSSSVRTSTNQLNTTTKVSFTFTTPADLNWYAVRIDNRATSNTITNIQIESGNQPTTYEPYVGGIPAPNPDYPQTVNTVTGRQVVTISDGDSQSQSFEVNLGKNLFDKSTVTLNYRLSSDGTLFNENGYFTSDYFEIEPSTTYTFSRSGAGSGAGAICYYDSSKTIIYRTMPIIPQSDSSGSMTSPSNARYARICDYTSLIDSVQIEKGSTATSYAAYFTPIELCKSDTYQDYVYKSGSRWYVHKEIGIHTTLTSEVSLYSDSYSNLRYVVIPKPADCVYYGNYGSSTKVFYTTATRGTASTGWDDAAKIGKIFSGPSANNFWIGFPKSVTLADAQTKLASSVLCYPLTTPTDTQITNQDLVGQLNALYAAQTYGDDTRITVTSAGLVAGFSADYITTKRVEKLYGGVKAVGELKMAGDTTQQTYTGKNLLNVDSSYTISNIYQAKSISLASGGTYTLQIDNMTTDGSGESYITIRGNGSTLKDTYISNTNKSYTFTLTANADEMYIYADKSYSSSQGKTTTFTNMMVSQNSSPTSYEPYVGRIPAPNPDYPQTVNTVTGRQVVEINNKNLWNPTPTTTGYVITAQGTLYALASGAIWETTKATVGESYTLSVVAPAAGTLRIHSFKSDGTWNQQVAALSLQSSESGNVTFTIPNGTDVLKWSFFVGATNGQLEQGATATPYQPYQSQSYEVNLGKNLLDSSAFVGAYINASGNVVADSGNNNALFDYIPVSADTSYTASYNGSGAVQIQYAFFDSSKSIISRDVDYTQVTSRTVTTPASCAYVRVWFYRSPAWTQTIVDESKLQLEKGSQATTYAPYICCFGKNLFDKDNATIISNYFISGSGSLTASNGFNVIVTPCEPSTTYTLSWMELTPSESNRCRIATSSTVITTSSTGMNIVENYTSGYHSPLTFTTPANAHYIGIDIMSSTTTAMSDILSSIQLEKGSTATTYNPYLAGPLELCKIGTYQDYIYKSSGNWYLHKETQKLTLGTSNGENWIKSGQSTSTIFIAGLENLRNFSTITDENAICVASSFVFNGNSFTANNQFIISGYQNGSFRFMLFRFSPTSSITDLASFTTWVGNNNIMVYVGGITPTDTQITNQDLIDQLDAIEGSTSYGEDTHLTVDGDLPAIASANFISAKEIIKLYGSVNGQSKLVYKALS